MILGMSSQAWSLVSRTFSSPYYQNHFRADLVNELKQFSGKVSVVLYDFLTGDQFLYEPTQNYSAASLIKIPVFMHYFSQKDQNKIDLDNKYFISNKDFVIGSGLIQTKPPQSYSVRELLNQMMIQSDNTAANYLIKKIGMNRLQNYLTEINLKEMKINNLIFAKVIKGPNQINAIESAKLLQMIYLPHFFKEDSHFEMNSILKNQKRNEMLPRYLPKQTIVAHKTGSTRRVAHDVGIVFHPHGDYLICVLTSGSQELLWKSKFIGKISKKVFDYYQSHPRH